MASEGFAIWRPSCKKRMMTMKRDTGKIVLGIMMGTLLAGCATSAVQPKSERPLNIVLIVADDLGVNDVGYHGNMSIRTPRLDRLAATSTVFNTAYASSPVCATSRAALLTGQHQQRFGMESNPSPRQLAAITALQEPGAELVPEELGDPPHPERGLPPEAVTIAERLQAAGYRTAHIGKWHLGSAPGYTPNDQGFSDFFGFLGGASMFAERDDPHIVGAQLKWNGLDNLLWDRLPYSLQRNGEPDSERGYQTDVFAAAAADYIENSGEEPFFLSIGFNAPHNPLQAPKSLVDAQPTEFDHHKRVYYAMIESLDAGIGTVLDALERANMRDRTLVIITSDNGGASYLRIDDVNAPLRGFKANFWEGGIRVPLIIDHPLNSETIGSVEEPVSLLDLAPTILSAAGVNAETLDGQALFKDHNDSKRTLIWRNHTLSAIRHGDWKLIHDTRRDRSWLYNIAEDPNEANDLVKTYPEKADALSMIYATKTADWPDSPAWAPTYVVPVHADPVKNPLEADNDDWTFWPG